MSGWWELRFAITAAAGTDRSPSTWCCSDAAVADLCASGCAAGASRCLPAAASRVFRRREGDDRLAVAAALPPLPADPTNRFADDPAAAALGATLFFDQRLSRDGKVACATCHMIDRQFQDDLPRAVGVRHDQPAHHAARRRRLEPVVLLGRPARQPVGAGADAAGGSRSSMPATAPPTRTSWPTHFGERYERIFGPLPDRSTGCRAMPGRSARAAEKAAWAAMTDAQREGVDRVFANIGKAIAAFERSIVRRRRASTASPRRSPPARSRRATPL